MVLGRGGDLRRTIRGDLLGLAAPRLDTDLQRMDRLSAVVRTDFHCGLSVRARQLVLLDPPLDASAQAVSRNACGPPRQPPSHCMDGDELSSAGIDQRRGVDPSDGFCRPHPSWFTCRRVDSRNNNGRNQSYGLGNVPALARSFAIGEVGDNSKPSRAAPRGVPMQFRAIFSLLGSGLRNRQGPVTADGGRARGITRTVNAAVLIAVGAAASAAIPAAANEVSVTVTNIRSSEGVVRACLTIDAKSFPNCRKDPKAQKLVVPAGSTVTFKFKGVTAGDYAIAVLHDKNDNGKADRTLGMFPKEGYGFSRDAKVQFGPPKWKDAVFKHTNGSKKMTIKMRYW